MSDANSLNYKTLFELISKSVIIADHEFKVLYANPHALELLELEIDRLQAKDLLKALDVADDKYSRLKELPLSRETECVSGLYHYTETDCVSLNVLFRGVPLPTKGRMGYYIELEKAGTMEFSEDNIKKLGTKTGQIAHDFSNPLAVLKMQCENFNMIAQKTPTISSTEIIERIKKMNKATDRLNITTDELKKLSRSLTELNVEEIQTMLNQDDPVSSGGH